MPKRKDLNCILVIGAGPIVIGQACEFDYSGVQAIKALKDEGYRVVLVNSNPATIMTDPELADATYIEPITPEFVEKIIALEKPDAVLPTMGGQTALNCALDLAKSGALARHGVEMIGADSEAIEKAEDRQKFRDAMTKIGLDTPRSKIAKSMEDVKAIQTLVGLPAIIRPSFTLGGTGGGIAYNLEEYYEICEAGLQASPVNEILIEESVLGWKEYEMEVVRDKADNCIIICSIENIDPMGVHTGDSITVAPALTLSDREYQIMRNASIAVLQEIGVETGGSNVQFAINPQNGRLIVIEMNPRVSRSSALASKATGFPIAKIAAKLAVGYTLDELDNDITGVTPASFEPTLDYIVTKIPRFAFEKYAGVDQILTTSMKSVGEAMAIGRSFPESLQKALRSLETGLSGLDDIEIEGYGCGEDEKFLKAICAKPLSDRILYIAQALRHGLDIDSLYDITHFDKWFLRQIAQIVTMEKEICEKGLTLLAEDMLRFKQAGFSDSRIAKLLNTDEKTIRTMRRNLGVRPVYKRVDTCAGEFEAQTPYLYSTYEKAPYGTEHAECEARISSRKKVMILGGGPNRIGQGIEFDYCCCHAAFAMNDLDIESIMVNCNPETVSTDYDTSDRLYFEPLSLENVLEIVDREKQSGEFLGVIVQFGGQTPLKLAQGLAHEGVAILGTSPDSIDLAEDRERFKKILEDLDIQQAPSAIAHNKDEAELAAQRIGYPLMLRPSYVLGGRAMEIIHDNTDLHRYIDQAMQVSGDGSLLIDRYLSDAIEVDVDALCDGETVHIAGVMEHIEEAGIHSGDSACALPPYSLSETQIANLKAQTAKLALALEVKGLINIQFALKDDEIYILEANPRAARTIPFVAKAVGRPIAAIAAKLQLGAKLEIFNLSEANPRRVAVKESVFPFARFLGVDPVLGPEMRSTGEAMGWDDDFGAAFLKSQIASGIFLPETGTAFLSVKDSDKPALLDCAHNLLELGFDLLATGGTANVLEGAGLPVTRVNKVAEGRPHIVDRMKNGDVQLVFNTTEGVQSLKDSADIRRTALAQKIPYFTTIAASRASVQAIGTLKARPLEVRALQA